MKNCGINSLSYVCSSPTSGEQFESVTFPYDRVVSLSSLIKGDLNTAFSAIERSLVQDFTEYYDKFDGELGIRYNKILRSKMYFNNGVEIVCSGTEIQNSGQDNVFCIRQLNLENIRSFEVGLQGSDFSDLVGKNMTEMSVALAPQTWIYLERIVNKVLGWDFVKVGTTELSLTFNLLGDEEKDRIAKGVYLLLSEIICFCSSGNFPIVLVSELPSDRLICQELLSLLNSMKYDYQVFIP